MPQFTLKPWLACAALFSMSSLAFLTVNSQQSSVAQSPTRPAPIEEFIVRGTEPFWAVNVGRRGIVYTTPDAKPQTFPYVAPIAAQGRPLDLVRVYRFRGSNNVLVLRKGACSDGMSDKQYPYSATLVMGNTVREGCAEKQR